MSARSPERAQFDHLYRHHLPAIVAWARRRIEPDEVDDLVAEVFTVAWRRRHRVPEDALPWLLAVAGNVLRNRRRAADGRRRLAQRLAALPPPAGPEVDRIHVIDPDLAEALRALSARDLELLLLIAWEGLDCPRAAAALGCSPVAARLRLHRIRRRLGSRLHHLAPRPAFGAAHTHQSEERGIDG